MILRCPPVLTFKGLFSVQGEPKGGPLYFEGDELGGLAVLFHFSIPGVFLKRGVTSASGPAGSHGRVFSHLQSK